MIALDSNVLIDLMIAGHDHHITALVERDPFPVARIEAIDDPLRLRKALAIA